VPVLPVITDRQTTAIALTTAVLTTLIHARIAPAAAHVVIAGAERNSLVAGLAAAAGIGEIDSWGLNDAHNFPLHTLTRRGGVVIDLLGTATRHPARHRRQAGALDPPDRVIAVDEPSMALLALPGLLATAQTSGRPPGRADCLACVRALVERTPPGRVLPELSVPSLTEPALPAAITAASGPPRPAFTLCSMSTGAGARTCVREEIRDDRSSHPRSGSGTHQPPAPARLGP
jgi:malate dehydrogenase (oxaloacetate-decarboxylating)